MESLIALLTLLNTLSPLGVISLLATIIFLQIRGKQEVSGQVDTLANNHLHSLPDIAETLRRMEASQTENFAWIRAKLGDAK